MKKNMLLAILIATFFSCTEILDEITITDDGLNMIEDSLQNVGNKEDTTIMKEDSLDQEEVSDNIIESESSGTFYTEKELAIWRERAQYGPYKNNGDAGQNTPGDFSRILSNANEFLSNPKAERYTITKFPVPQWYEPAPHNNGVKLRDAAFVYLLKKDEKYLSAVRDELIAQVSEPSMDFSDQSKWKDGGLLDINPSFIITEWLARLLYAYDYIKQDLSQNEKDQIEKWFLNAALFFQENVDYSISQAYSNRNAGVISSIASSSSKKTSINGISTYPIQRWYNNRRSNQIRFSGLVGIMLDHEGLKSYAKTFVKEYIKYAVFPNGLTGEFERSAPDRVEAGFFYTFATITHLGQLADAFARTGDTELYDFETSKGALGTEGGNKSLLLVMKTLCKLSDGSMSIYVGNSKTEDSKIDGKDGNEIWAYHVWFSQFNSYYKDEYLRKTYENILNTNLKIASSGPHQQWGGSGNVLPGVLFMYGQMENSTVHQ